MEAGHLEQLGPCGRDVKDTNLLTTEYSRLARVTSETSQVLLAGGQVVFLGGSPVFASPND